MLTVLLINASTSATSANMRVLQMVQRQLKQIAHCNLIESLRGLPPFDADEALLKLPMALEKIQTQISLADVIVISSPEYIFSMPSNLKNLFEWSVAARLFLGKQTAVIVAAADGTRTFEQIKFVLTTIEAKVQEKMCLHLPGAKGKLTRDNQFATAESAQAFTRWIDNLKTYLQSVIQD